VPVVRTRTRHPGEGRPAALAVLWLHPDRDTPGAVIEGRALPHLPPSGAGGGRGVHPVGDGPIITGALAEDSTPGSVAYPARRWLLANGWTTAPDLACAAH